MDNSEHVWGADGQSPSDTLTPSEASAAHAAPLDTAAHSESVHAPVTHLESASPATLQHSESHAGHAPHHPEAHAHAAPPFDVVDAIQAGEQMRHLQQTPETAVSPAVSPAPPARAPFNWSRVRDEVVAGAQTLFSAAVYATLIVTFGFQVARVDGLSMAPTLDDHDRLIVNKMVYEFGEPRPGDIVMLYYPLNPDKMFVKRVIASEGDVVRIVDGRVYVNDLPLHDDYVPEEFRSHDDWGPKVIDQGYYFVMGDHRNNSSDSRHWGLVPKKYIVGKVKVRIWPFHDARIF